ncbi:DUF4136 domain-containing protein [Peristeroidobacter soli]|uniref:DUF4136 domain-containing protein n=1 Tax=Peristeroidobacter soli TaxID=2497877 RepID=UPI00101B8DC1|nr:DUF4136 domain-containing protein [Peristeroidobacter soli]
MNAVKSIATGTLSLMVALLAACASKPTIRSNVDPTADFSRFQTYGYFDEVTGRKSPYDSFATTYIKNAIDHEMQLRGFEKSKNPQLLVNTHVQTKDKVQVTETPYGGGYYGYRYGMYGWGAGVSTTVDNYTEGTLNVDVVDVASKKLLWEGIAVGRIHDKARDNPQPAVNEVVSQIFEKFPKQPAGAPPKS